MIKAVLFDSWGTLLENGVFPSPVKQVQRILNIRLAFSEYITKFEHVFMLGKYSSLRDAFEEVAKEFDVPAKPFIIDKLVGMWNKNMLLAKPFPEAVEVLTRLKKDHKLAFVSNTDPFSIGPVLEKFDLRKHFNVIACSYEVGYLKTDRQMFEHVLRKLAVKKNEAVMVGDSMESDIAPAEAYGVKAVLVDRRGTRDNANKVANLSELDKFLK
ncbi:MAG: HAD family hydrolase [Candidatus Woesearchaeota archaeon]